MIVADRPEQAHEAVDLLTSPAEVWHDADGDVFAYCRSLDGRYRLDLPDVATFCFDARAEEVSAVHHRSLRSDELLARYCHDALPLILPALGTEVLHASAVTTARGVVGLSGPSRAGKSTLAFALSRRGHAVWADDALALDLSGPVVEAVPLPFDMRLRPASTSWFFGRDAGHLAFPRRDWEDATRAASRPLRAVCVLKRAADGRDLVIVKRLPASAAFVALLARAFSFGFDTERKRTMVTRYLALSARTPVFEVQFAPGLDRLAAILDAIERAIDIRVDEAFR